MGHVLHARRSSRRAPGRIRHRLSPLHRQLRAAVSGHRRLELRSRVCRWTNAATLRALQQRSEVFDAARCALAGLAQTRSPQAIMRGSSRSADGRWLLKRSTDPGEGSVVLSVLADAGSTRPRRLSCWRPARSPRCASRRDDLALPWPTSQTARRSASFPTATTRPLWSGRNRPLPALERSSMRTDRRSARMPASIDSPSVSARAWASRRRRRCTC